MNTKFYSQVNIIKYLVIISLISFSFEIENCMNEKKVCKSCNPDFTLVQSNDNTAECINSTNYEKIKNITDNCIEGDPQYKTCRECKRDYLLDRDKKHCLYLPHCSKIENENDCKSCDKGYALDNGTCTKKPLCEEIEENECYDCYDFYYPNDKGECIRIPIEHCKEGNSTNCFDCEQPYHLDDKNTKCLLYEHCINFDEKTKKCQFCESYYYPNEEGKCEIIGNHCMSGTPTKCLKCEDDYYVNDDGICEKKTEHCYYFDTIHGVCKRCQEYYYLFNETKCEKIGINHCTYGTPENCTNCEPSYYVFDPKTCKEIGINHCRVGTPTECKGCDTGYYLKSKTECDKIPDHCSVFDLLKNRCTSCEDYYYVYSDLKCEKIGIDHCTRGTPQECTECEFDYYVKNGTCAPKPEHCKSFDYLKQECESCESYYYVVDGGCAKIPINNCVKGDQNECTKCEEDYIISYDKKSCIKPCKEYEMICMKCKDNYATFDYGKTCSVLDPNLEPKNEGSFYYIDWLFAALISGLIL